MNKTKVQRNSNLEILRIIAMLFIIAHHFSVHGFGDVNFAISNANNYVIYFFGILGKIGVDVFIIISAYFMIDSKFNLKKLFVLGGDLLLFDNGFNNIPIRFALSSSNYPRNGRDFTSSYKP